MSSGMLIKEALKSKDLANTCLAFWKLVGAGKQTLLFKNKKRQK